MPKEKFYRSSAMMLFEVRQCE